MLHPTATRRGGCTAVESFTEARYSDSGFPDGDHGSCGDWAQALPSRRTVHLTHLSHLYPDAAPSEIIAAYDSTGCDLARAEERLERERYQRLRALTNSPPPSLVSHTPAELTPRPSTMTR